MTDLQKAEAHIKVLQRHLMQERVRRLSAEKQAAQASMAVLQMRLPTIDQELDLAHNKLAELTKEEDGASGN